MSMSEVLDEQININTIQKVLDFMIFKAIIKPSYNFKFK
jgi:hypothetical protein